MTMHAIGLTTLNNTAKDFRNDMSVTMFGATAARPTGARSGVRYGTPSTTVSLVAFAGTIKPHSGVMDVQTSAAAGPYFYAVTANETFTVSAAHATLPRVDIVTIRINDNVEDASGLETCTAHYKAGTAAASPVAPTPDTTREIIIATIAVPASGGGNPVVSWVAPYAVAAGGIIPVRTATELAALWAAYPPTTDAPVITTRKDATAGKIIEYSVDGTNKYVLDARLSTDPDPLAARAAYTFRPADSSARAAITGMRIDDRAYQIDTGVTYRYNGAAWKEWESGWLTWTPTLTGVTLGTGPVTEYQYRWVGGVADFDLSIKLGTSGAFTGQPTISLPITAKALRYSSMTYDGVASGANAGGNIYPLAVLASGASTTVVTFWSTLSGAYAAVSATVPHTWAANSVLQARFRVIPA